VIIILAAWLAAGLVAILVARSGSVRAGVWMELALGLVVGLTYTYVRTYHAQLPPSAPEHYWLPPTLHDWLNRFAPGMLATFVVLLEPLLLRRLWVLGRRSGVLGVWGFRLALAGLMLLLAAALTAGWWFLSNAATIKFIWGHEAAKGSWFGMLVYPAILLCLAGVVLLSTRAVRTGLLIGEISSLFLAFLLIIMPVVAALPMAFGFWDVRTMSRTWAYVVGLPWLLLGSWLVTRPVAGFVSGEVT